MCGIVGAIAKDDIVSILVDGLKRLEYRGYDSAGIAVLNTQHELQRIRCLGKVAELESELTREHLHASLGIAHTRWATHGAPTVANAHPHISNQRIAVVHNGIIENFAALKQELIANGAIFTSETDTEVIAHLIYFYAKQSTLMEAVQKTITRLEGAFAIGVIDTQEPTKIIAVRKGSPLIIGISDKGHYLASDHLALLPVTQHFIFLEEGDLAELYSDHYQLYDQDGNKVTRPIIESNLSAVFVEKGLYPHYMLKEIHEQAIALHQTLEYRLEEKTVNLTALGSRAEATLKKVKRIQIVACGTSYHAGLVARYWLESLANIACHVEIASEFRYRDNVVEPDTLFITISQSGETADTLSALRKAKSQGYLASLTVCNVSESALVRESDLALLTKAGPEVGVASTKAFTTQLIAFLWLTTAFMQIKKHQKTAELVKLLRQCPVYIESIFQLDDILKEHIAFLAEKEHTLFLGRGIQYPIALEGALKLKEISYIHAEAYAAGELKHGPLALIDNQMPVIALLPNDHCADKMMSNLQEVHARGGQLIVLADHRLDLPQDKGWRIIAMPAIDPIIAPIIYTVPLQLIAYYVALAKGNDVDRPRNLAKSVTVE